ncbi:polyheme membrane-associated cytochrome C [Aquibium microcysteis]|uniref:polyheme membrane-associated cytochrome C n=1 Tax=Aquibium microcysteis TaxID=675281 RepID=UPI001EF1B609|nr:polyheme membrane-associated cytochrome C [Aquibium microcysteis]
MRLVTLSRRFLVSMLVGLGLCGPAAAQQDDALSALVDAWLASPHGSYHSPSFTYWNKEGAVPVQCAACHSQPGFVDFLGADGSAAGIVDAPAAINAPIGCASCHNSAAGALDSVTFPSGVTVDELGASATCNVCHQGRASTDAVAAATQSLEEDAVSADLGFINVHYGVAAAVAQGSQVRGGYQYPGRRYSGRFHHVPSASACVDCHEPHATTVELEPCLTCHRGVGDVRAIRMRHSDFDGDGNAADGIHSEIMGLHARLGDAIQAYAADVSAAPIGYAKETFPYFFADTNADGQIGPDEAVFPNRYRSWTPRLLKAAYNYQVAAKDPGGYVHNPSYMLQLLYDSLESLAERVEIDMTSLDRP